MLRFGVPTIAACALSNAGLRHRRAAISLGAIPEVQAVADGSRMLLLAVVSQVLRQDEAGWRVRLGGLVYDNTLADVGQTR
jgi:hypothetical protein